MLRVKTYLDKSKIKGAGIGLFAGENIPLGKVIWEYDEGIDILTTINDIKLLYKIDPHVYYFFNKYSYAETEEDVILCIDNARFINHSVKSNLTDSTPYVTSASRFIRKGEELLSNYGEFSNDLKSKKFNTKL